MEILRKLRFNGLICRKTGSKFNTNRDLNHDVCVYHLDVKKNKIMKRNLEDYLRMGAICENSVNHVKALLRLKDDL